MTKIDLHNNVDLYFSALKAKTNMLCIKTWMIFMSDVLDIRYPTRTDSIVTCNVYVRIKIPNGFKINCAWQQQYSPGFSYRSINAYVLFREK